MWAAFADATGVSNVDSLVVRQLPYFEVIGRNMADTKVDTLRDYLTFKLVGGNAGLLSQDLVDLQFGFFSTTLRGVPENQPRWKRAVGSTSQVLGEVLGQQYVEKYFTPEAKDRMDQLVANLIAADRYSRA